MRMRKFSRWSTWVGLTTALLLLVLLTILFQKVLTPQPAPGLTISLDPGESVRAVSSDFQTLVTRRWESFDDAGPVRVWSLETGSQLFTVEIPTKDIPDYYISPDGRWLLLSFLKDGPQIWSISERKLHGRPTLEPEGTHHALFSPDSRLVVVEHYFWPSERGRSGNKIRVFDLETLQPLTEEIPATREQVRFALDGRRFALVNFSSWRGPGFLELWERAGEKESFSRVFHRPMTADCFALSPDFETCITFEPVDQDENAFEMTLLSTKTGKAIAAQRIPGEQLNHPWCRFSNDGRLVTVWWRQNPMNRDVRRPWTETTTGVFRVGPGLELLTTFAGFAEPSPDMSKFALFDDAGAAVWNLKPRKVLARLPRPALSGTKPSLPFSHEGSFLCWLPDNQTVAIPRRVKVYKASDIKKAFTFEFSLFGRNDDEYLSFVDLHRADTGERLVTLENQWETEFFNPDGPRILSIQKDGSVQILNGLPQMRWMLISGASGAAWLLIVLSILGMNRWILGRWLKRRR